MARLTTDTTEITIHIDTDDDVIVQIRRLDDPRGQAHLVLTRGEADALAALLADRRAVVVPSVIDDETPYTPPQQTDKGQSDEE